MPESHWGSESSCLGSSGMENGIFPCIESCRKWQQDRGVQWELAQLKFPAAAKGKTPNRSPGGAGQGAGAASGPFRAPQVLPALPRCCWNTWAGQEQPLLSCCCCSLEMSPRPPGDVAEFGAHTGTQQSLAQLWSCSRAPKPPQPQIPASLLGKVPSETWWEMWFFCWRVPEFPTCPQLLDPVLAWNKPSLAQEQNQGSVLFSLS